MVETPRDAAAATSAEAAFVGTRKSVAFELSTGLVVLERGLKKRGGGDGVLGGVGGNGGWQCGEV